MATKDFLDVEELEVYKKLCRLHIEVCDLTHEWPHEEKYELGSQARRSSNGENIGAENSRVRAALAGSRGNGSIWRR